MTINRDFKRLVRARMEKTGESYTSARTQLLRTAKPRTAVPFAVLAGLSDAAVKAATGCAWESWVNALDAVKAYAWPHRAIAEYVHEKYKVRPWWTQMVTVGYERVKGLRDRGQRRGGSYETSKSRTFDVPMGRLYDAFAKPVQREQWLDGADLHVRMATRNRSMRITWGDGTSVELWFTKKARAKSQVAVQCTRLPSSGVAAEKKMYWEARLDALGLWLPGSRTPRLQDSR